MSGTSAAGAPGATSFTYGRNTQVVLVHPLAPGGTVTIPNVTRFHCRAVYDTVKMTRLDGLSLHQDIPKEWSGEIDADRGSAALDALVAKIEQQWKTLGTITWGTLYQYVSELNGSTSTYQFQNCSIAYEDGGDWRGNSLVQQKIKFTASQRVQVS